MAKPLLNTIIIKTEKLFVWKLHKLVESISEEMFYIQKRLRSDNRKTVTMIPGAGLGPELMGYLKDIFQKVNAPVDFEEVHLDPNAEVADEIKKIAKSIKKNGVAIKGNIETCSPDGIVSRNADLRKELDLFACIFHCFSYSTVKARHANIDIVIIRQNTGGEYSLLEHETVPGVTECLKIMTRKRCERLATYAFEYAKKNNRKKVTTIHKANIMKLTDGLYLETSKNVAKKFSDIEHKDMIVDNCCMQIISNPGQFDVMLTTNLYGSIIGNTLAGLAGGPGLWSCINHGADCAVFEPALRTTGACLVGKGIANPVAMINAGVDLLRFLGFKQQSQIISSAISKTLCAQVFTKGEVVHFSHRLFENDVFVDLRGSASTCEVVESIKQNLVCSN